MLSVVIGISRPVRPFTALAVGVDTAAPQLISSQARRITSVLRIVVGVFSRLSASATLYIGTTAKVIRPAAFMAQCLPRQRKRKIVVVPLLVVGGITIAR